MRSMHPDDGDEIEQFEKIFFKLRAACDIATQALPHCHREFTVHKDNAETAGKARDAHYWSLALTKCNAVIRACQALSGRLKQVKLKDPGVRNQREFWQLCDAFVQVRYRPLFILSRLLPYIKLFMQTWAELATEVKDIGQQRIDITTIKMVMKPVQRAVKDVSKTISDSPLYHAALRSHNNANAFGLASPQSLAPPFQGGNYQGNFAANLNTVLAQQSLAAGPPTSVPATPLAAALGPAAQATLSYASQPQSEYFPSHGPMGSNAGIRGMHERLDTMIQHPVGPSGAYGHYGGQPSYTQHPSHSQYQHPHPHQQQYHQQPNIHNYPGFPHTARRVAPHP